MKLVLSAAFALTLFTGSALAQQIGAYKDDLFAYPAELARADNGRFRTVDYQEARDINGRDEVPERRVKRQYVSLAVRSQQNDVKVQTKAGEVRTVAVGRQKGASMIVLYLHGQGGSRRQGADDFTFGGNFNRVKNLVVSANGLYLSPDFSDFGEGGGREISALIDHYAALSPSAKVFVACGSMGGGLCYELARKPEVVERLGGLLLLGSHWDDSFLQSPAFKARVPIFFGQGARDKVFPLEKQMAFFRLILAASPDYPARFVSFENGTHGTPIRMTDWRETLNWMLSATN
ncbi:lysophospholipase [Mesorhizobium sp. RP14(2022)]|uniref:Lysophospholipase n=1 Tax=Mesorhizobium liriopis TaxID=2953882 RepID=A0ABT1CDT8_9HYPH|nr:lysophospholipase [Mesorhizobium liriopis]MCO6052116.1 lysophospholipase [Mesorhizobium liriopis]